MVFGPLLLLGRCGSDSGTAADSTDAARSAPGIVSPQKFIDDTHAVVRFDLSIPDHGNVLADRAGYAVFVDGSWKVALRTVCDIVSLDGTTQTCPPAPAR